MTSEQRLDQLEKGKELVTLGTTGNGVVYAGNRKGEGNPLQPGPYGDAD
tara:strand:- start:850 stop:996 length:147 start_codon:yes stop_codon:yes gene_type:complete